MIMVDLEKDLSPKEVMGIHDYPAEVAETMYQSMKLLQQTYPNSFIGSNGSGFNVRTLGEESSQTVKWLHVHFAPEGLNNIQPSFYKKASQVPPSVRALILGSEGARLWASLSARYLKNHLPEEIRFSTSKKGLKVSNLPEDANSIQKIEGLINNLNQILTIFVRPNSNFVKKSNNSMAEAQQQEEPLKDLYKTFLPANFDSLPLEQQKNLRTQIEEELKSFAKEAPSGGDFRAGIDYAITYDRLNNKIEIHLLDRRGAGGVVEANGLGLQRDGVISEEEKLKLTQEFLEANLKLQQVFQQAGFKAETNFSALLELIQFTPQNLQALTQKIRAEMHQITNGEIPKSLFPVSNKSLTALKGHLNHLKELRTLVHTLETLNWNQGLTSVS